MKKPKLSPLVRVESGWPSPFPFWVPDWVTGLIMALCFVVLVGYAW